MGQTTQRECGGSKERIKVEQAQQKSEIKRLVIEHGELKKKE
jgi:hypothetical protein